MLTATKNEAPWMTKALAAIFALTVPAVVFAFDDGDSQALPTGIGSSEILNIGTSLVLILIAIIVTGRLYRRSQGIQRQNAEIINVLATQALGPKERVLLVKVGNKQLVLGTTATQIQMLHVLEQPLPNERQISPSTGFAARLRAAIKGAGK